MKKEIWKTLQENPIYIISNHGRIKSIDRLEKMKNGRVRSRKGRTLKPREHTRGYLRVYLSGKKEAYIHRLVANNFITNKRNDQIEVNHIDGDKKNNKTNNLEWVNPKEHRKHSETLISVINGHKKQSESLKKTWEIKKTIS